MAGDKRPSALVSEDRQGGHFASRKTPDGRGQDVRITVGVRIGGQDQHGPTIPKAEILPFFERVVLAADERLYGFRIHARGNEVPVAIGIDVRGHE